LGRIGAGLAKTKGDFRVAIAIDVRRKSASMKETDSMPRGLSSLALVYGI
jgi:hypothetical protein